MSRFRALLVGTAFLAMACNQSGGGATPLPTQGPIGSIGLPSFAAPSPSPSASAVPSVLPTTEATASPSPSTTSTPAVTPSPVATPAPTNPPSESPAPSASDLGDTGPTSQAGLFASFLRGADLPPDAQGGTPKLQTPGTESDAFTANNGIREASATWSSTHFTSLFDIRFQFPTADDAAAFLDAEEPALSETSSGLKPYDASIGNADDLRAYRGTISVLGITTQNYNFLMRVGNFVAKVFITGDDTLSGQEAEGFAIDAAARLIAVVNSGPLPSPSATIEPSPSAAPEFNDDELDLLVHVPTVVQAGCQSVDTIYASEIDSVRCVNEGQPDIDYTSFANAKDMEDELASDKDLAETTPTAKGTCSKANYEDTYTIDGNDAGTIRCMVVTGQKTGTKYKVIEWTNDKLLILSYMSSSTMAWDDLISFWQSSAGPLE